jgi:hypothetical protein
MRGARYGDKRHSDRGVFVLAIYMYGGGVMSTLVYYKSWKLVGEEELAAVHSSVSSRMLPRFGPVLVPAGAGQYFADLVSPSSDVHTIIGITAALHFFILVVSFTLFRPIHNQLDKAKSVELIDRLVAYDRYMRLVPGCIIITATIVMLYQVVSASPR